MTGLERARLERTYTPSAADELPPQPMMVDKPKNHVPPTAPAPQKPVAAANPSVAHLFVGPGVTLKGEIAGCDTLRVEGRVEGNGAARQLVVCSGGSFLGTVDIEEADVEGKFEGTLNVSGRLLLRATGNVSGTLSYGQIEVERGGQILGDVTVRGAASTRTPAISIVRAAERAPSAAERPAPSAAERPAPSAAERPAPSVNGGSDPLKKPTLVVRT